ncbi:MAG TPA: hypothetical protein VKI43_15125 [Vicinamibacterales bacterium]|nr:hypothetical protein [Vicinamibacterales bacterium]
MRRPTARIAVTAVGGLLLAASLFAQNNYQFSDPNVEDLFRYARMGAGGGAVSKLKALQLKGRSRVDMGGSLLDCSVDIKILLPDHYLRVDATKTDSKLAGYAGKTVLSAIRSGDNLSTPPDNLTSTILKNERTRLARLLLGAITYVTPDVSMVFHSAGLVAGMVDPRNSARTAATASGNAIPNTADINSPDGFKARIIFDSTDRMPLTLLYPGSPQEETMTFTDRRDVGGLKVPFHVTTTAGGRVIDDLIFESVLVNPEIGKGDFKR